ncbi:19494_t:CDS:1, partial [Cetraspora pellucida]
AFEYYLKSTKAEYGHCCGMYNVGRCYQNVIEVEKNKDFAFEWYLKLAVMRHNCNCK